MKTKYKSMPKGKFGPQNRVTVQPVVKTKAMKGVKFQEANTANTAAAIVKKTKDNTVPAAKSIAMAGAKMSPYRFKHTK